MNPSILTDPALTLTDTQAYVIARTKRESVQRPQNGPWQDDQTAETVGSTRTGKFTELAMKHHSCARW
jgi:hypothetical protein